MDITNINGKHIKISKNSITVKDDNNKTCGVIRNIISLYDIQPNKQCDIYHKLLNDGIRAMDYGIKDIIIKNDTIYFINNIKSKLHYDKYDFFDDNEKNKYMAKERMIQNIKTKGYNVIDCIYY